MAPFPHSSRRQFLRGLLGAGVLSFTGFRSSSAQTSPESVSPQAFRFAFLTDLHLMKDGALRSADGIAACLTAVENLNPRPEFILVGGDLVHRARDYSIADAEGMLDFFLKIWHDHTSLPAHWTFGNHDLVGTSNPAVSTTDRHYAKGLFKDRFGLPELFYSFDYGGWHFVVLDDITLQPDRRYIGELADEDLTFLRNDLDANRAVPTILCTHIPVASNAAFGLYLTQALAESQSMNPKTLVCENNEALFADLPQHNIRAILSGHLHHLERLPVNGVPIINSGAVCGNYWAGSMLGTEPGFGVVDLKADGSVEFDYRDYGWKA